MATTTTEKLREATTWGLRFTDAADIKHVADALLDGYRGKDGEYPLVVTPNVDIMITLEDADSRVRETVNRAAVVLADGQPLVSFSRFAGDSLQTRLAGSDLTAAMWPQLVAENRATFAIAPTPMVIERLAMEHQNFDAIAAPMLPAEAGSLIDRFAWETIQRIAAMSELPEFVFLGVGFSKDVLIARSILEQWPAELGEPPVLVAVGASLEFITGLKKRAPEIYQRLGVEFLHRMMSDPKRLMKRYLVRDARFLLIMMRHMRA